MQFVRYNLSEKMVALHIMSVNFTPHIISLSRLSASHVGRPLTPALPYSKDFGTFDLTLCEGPDGRCIVLVEYDQRTFLNGKQVRNILFGRMKTCKVLINDSNLL